MTPHAVILANGAPPPRELLRRHAQGAVAFVCADGAYAAALRARVRPDWIVGDMDSLPRRSPKTPGLRFLLDDDPDRNDLEKALRLLLDSRYGRGFKGELRILGATGGRLDQTLASLQLVEAYSDKARLLLIDAGGELELVRGRREYACRVGQTVSLFPLGKARVRTTGLLYPLKGELLPPGSRGVSNLARAERFAVEVRGRCWLFRGH